jgi:hypothetical protein
MITQKADDGTVLMDREDLAVWLRRPVATIRAHCQPVAYDRATGRALYDAEKCQESLSRVGRRRVGLQSDDPYDTLGN